MSRLLTAAVAVAIMGFAAAAEPGSDPAASATAPMAQAEDPPREAGTSIPRPPLKPKQRPTPSERPRDDHEEGMPQRPCLPHNPQLGPPCVSPQR
jgi:hypothetical protein